MSSYQNINPKPCFYNCNTRIYWNTAETAYFEVFSRKNILVLTVLQIIMRSVTQITTSTTNKPTYSKISYFATQQQSKSKPKMSNPLELLQGSISEVQ